MGGLGYGLLKHGVIRVCVLKHGGIRVLKHEGIRVCVFEACVDQGMVF